MIIEYAAAYVVTLVIFLSIDAVWLGTMANLLYKPTLGDILLPKFSPAPAIFFYLIFIVGILIFAIAPAMKDGQWTTALIYGALFGFFSYGVYDFTNMATLRNWSLTITLADLCWGTVLTGTSASLGYILSGLALRALHMA
jgi:uncharacterized membrane protein